MYPDFLQSLKAQLRQTYSQYEADAILFWIIEDTVGLSRTEVITDRLSNIDSQQAAQLRERVGRVAGGEPVQYVLGFTDFCGLRIDVAPGVLIPRPETEELVALCVSELRQSRSIRNSGIRNSETDRHAPITVLDLCTGSGCIALALKKQLPTAIVEGWDISDKALIIAKDNAKRLNLDVEFRKVDITAPTSTPATTSPPVSSASTGSLSLLVSNPPYVCESERTEMERNVLDHEPALALFVPDDDPLRFYRAIARIGQQRLHAGGIVAVEINCRYGQQVAQILAEAGFRSPTVHQDSYGNTRFVTAYHR